MTKASNIIDIGHIYFFWLLRHSNSLHLTYIGFERALSQKSLRHTIDYGFNDIIYSKLWEYHDRCARGYILFDDFSLMLGVNEHSREPNR